MRDNRIHRNQLPAFSEWMIADGWTLALNSDRPDQAFRAWKLNFNGDKKKWCLLNNPPDLDGEYLVAPDFSASLVAAFTERKRA